MLKEPVFLDGENPFEKNYKDLKLFLESIFSQEPQKAFRRGEGQFLGYYLAHKKRLNIKGVDTLLGGRYIKLAQFINKILTYRLIPVLLIRKIKKFLKKES